MRTASIPASVEYLDDFFAISLASASMERYTVTRFVSLLTL